MFLSGAELTGQFSSWMDAAPQHHYCQTLLSVSEGFNFELAWISIASSVYSCKLGQSTAFVFTEQGKYWLFVGIYRSIQGGVWDCLLHPSVPPQGSSPGSQPVPGASGVWWGKSSFMGGQSMVGVGDHNFNSDNFEEVLVISMVLLMWTLLARC